MKRRGARRRMRTNRTAVMNFQCEKKTTPAERRRPTDSNVNSAHMCARRVSGVSKGPRFKRRTEFSHAHCTCSQFDWCARSLLCVEIWKTPVSVFELRFGFVPFLWLVMASPPKLFVFFFHFSFSLDFSMPCVCSVSFQFLFSCSSKSKQTAESNVYEWNNEWQKRERENVFRFSESHAAIY